MSAPSAPLNPPAPTPEPTCRSEHTIVVSPGNRLVNTQCARDPDHRGRCVDVHGRYWTRASEWGRMAAECAEL